MANFKYYWRKFINISFWFLFGIMIIMLALVCFMLIAQSTIMPMIAKHKAKDPSNIKTGGCLMYKGYQMKSGSVYSLNSQNSRPIKNIAVKNSPFERKWQSYNQRLLSKGLCKPIDPFPQFNHPRDFADYDGWFHKKFDKKYNNECFVVDYVSTKFWIFETDFIYDVDKNFICLE